MRHRFIFSVSVLVTAALVVTSCTEQGTTEPTAGAVSTLADGDDPLLSAHAGNPVVFSARGSLHKEGALAGGDPLTGLRTFSFTAVQRKKDVPPAATGHMQQNRHGGGQIQHGRVFCMVDLGDGFVLIGAQGTQRIPENTPDQFPPLPVAERPDNHGLFFVVKDNGEPGGNEPADQFTGYISTTVGVVDGICALGTEHPVIKSLLPILPFFLNDVEAGNIQVTFP